MDTTTDLRIDAARARVLAFLETATTRQRAALEWSLAKAQFRHVIWNTYGRIGTKGGDRYRQQARRQAAPHIEAWHALRLEEQRAVAQAA